MMALSRLVARLQEHAAPSYFHATDSPLDIGEVVAWKGRKVGHFGATEKVLEKYRPSSSVSRLSSFYLAGSYEEAEYLTEGGKDKCYKVSIVGQRSLKLYLGNIQALNSLVPADGKLAKLPSDERALIQTLCEQYWGGKRITRKQLAKADLEADGETSMWEILATRIKVLKEMSRSELVPIRY